MVDYIRGRPLKLNHPCFLGGVAPAWAGALGSGATTCAYYYYYY